jgi:hypothetical protein
MAEITPEQYQAWLDLAVAAYSRLVNGNSVREVVDQNGERVQFTSANLDKLLAWINWLRSQLGLDPNFGTFASRGPFKFTFGQRC